MLCKITLDLIEFEFLKQLLKHQILPLGIAFYTSNCKEVISPERKLILYDKKEKEFYDDFSGADNCPHSVRSLLDIPTREIAEVHPHSELIIVSLLIMLHKNFTEVISFSRFHSFKIYCEIIRNL